MVSTTPSMELMLIFFILGRKSLRSLRLFVLCGSPVLQTLLPPLLADVDEVTGLSFGEPRRGRGVGAAMNDLG